MRFSLLFLLCSLTLFGLTLQKSYYVQTDEIKLSSIIKNVQDDKVLFHIAHKREYKKIKSKKLIEILQKYGYTVQTTHRFVTFYKKSPVDLQFVKEYLQKYYKEYYPEIKIDSISVMPRKYISSLSTIQKIKIPKKAYLSNHAIISLATKQKKQIFLDYTVDATITALVAKKDIAREEEISFVNTTKKSIILTKFKAQPLIHAPSGVYESKFHIQAGKLITLRDVTMLHLIKRGNEVNVFLQSGPLSITFSAKALNNGKLGDTIKVQRSDGKRIKVIVTGKNRAKVI